MERLSPRADKLVKILIVASSLALLAFSVPRFLYELALVPSTSIEYLPSGGYSDEDLDLVAKTRESALEFHDNPDAHSILGGIYLRRAALTADQAEKAALLEKAHLSLQKTVTELPLRSQAWLNLATYHTLTDTPDYDQALLHWRKSIETGKFNPKFMLNRLHLGIFLSDKATNFSASDLDVLKEQFKLGFQWNKWIALKFGNDHALKEWFLYLSGTGNEMAEFLMQKM